MVVKGYFIFASHLEDTKTPSGASTLARWFQVRESGDISYFLPQSTQKVREFGRLSCLGIVDEARMSSRVWIDVIGSPELSVTKLLQSKRKESIVFFWKARSVTVVTIAECGWTPPEIILRNQRRAKHRRNLLYPRFGHIDEAIKVLHSIQDPNVFSWKILLRAFCDDNCVSGEGKTFDSLQERVDYDGDRIYPHWAYFAAKPNQVECLSSTARSCSMDAVPGTRDEKLVPLDTKTLSELTSAAESLDMKPLVDLTSRL
ncbi:hypothetical protein SELMODRAFT_430426 [Selaginella moellendorffii]|uniref:Uncharacterized protein n=1 Tax=Selaginella moellendorffii TaxID=88036 RepID=D8T9D5_SELML|nr:hypothetical protein SELMODRAFT_430426 [Selaginella moellendorffii]